MANGWVQYYNSGVRRSIDFQIQAALRSTEIQALKKSACATSQCLEVYSQMSDKSHPNVVHKRKCNIFEKEIKNEYSHTDVSPDHSLDGFEIT